MNRPAVEVADILHAQGDRFLERYRASFSYQQLKAFRAIANCRTPALGGHLDVCPACGQKGCDRPTAISYNSCRNRHCPKCPTEARPRWLAARQQELLPTSYLHVVFTVPHELNLLALENARLFYDLLFTARAQTALPVARDPKHLGAEIGMLSIVLGAESASAAPPPRCDSPGRSVATAHTLGLPALSLFSSEKSVETCLPRQVSGRTQAAISAAATALQGTCFVVG